MKKMDISGLTTEQWLKLRRRGIGGSDAPVIEGLSRHKAPVELWEEKTDQIPVDTKDTEFTYWGHVMENVIRNEFTVRTGLKVEPVLFMYRSEKHEFMQADLDGEVYDPQYGMCVFEAKNVSTFREKKWEESIPPEYYSQLQHYMAVTGYEGAYIAALIGGNNFIYRFIRRDEKYIRKLIRQEAAFWKSVQERTIPVYDGSDALKDYLYRKFPQAADSEMVDLGEDGIYLMAEYDAVSALESKISERKQAVENKLKSLIGEHEGATCFGRKITWKNITSQRFDSKAFQLAEPELYEKYTVTGKSRRFHVA